jgi:hypothetical protein
MKKEARCVTGINFLATIILSLFLSMLLGIQNHNCFSIRIKQILLTVACMFWMNLAFSQPIVKVIGSVDSMTVSKQVAQYLEYLDIRENIRLAVIFPRKMPKTYAGITICVNGADLKKDIGYLNIKVYLDARQPKFLQRIVLAHEMIHVKQYAKGELVVTNQREVMWKGQKYSSHNAEHGDPRPWEHEAYQNDTRLVKYCKEQSEIILPTSKTGAYVDHEPSQKQISDFQQKY